MAILLIIVALVAIGAVFRLLFALAALALPVVAGMAAGMWAHQSGAGLPGSVLFALVSAVLVVGIGHFLILVARPVWLKFAVTLAFVVPALIAGYYASHGIAKHLIPTETWQLVFSVAGAMAIGISAFIRLTSVARSQRIGHKPASA